MSSAEREANGSWSFRPDSQERSTLAALLLMSSSSFDYVVAARSSMDTIRNGVVLCNSEYSEAAGAML